MKYYVNKSTNTGDNELIGPFSTQKEAEEQLQMNLRLCSILSNSDKRFSVNGTTIQYENGEAIHFSLFHEKGFVDETIKAS